MASERDGQLIVFTCDHCDEQVEIADADGDFREAWAAAKEDGWRCFQNKAGEWEHRCPDCRGK